MPVSGAVVGPSRCVSFCLDFLFFKKLWIPPGKYISVRRWEKPLCVRVPHGRPRALTNVARRCASDTPLTAGVPTADARGHARYLPPGPFVSVPILPGPGVDAPAAWVPPPPWCHSRSLGLPPSPRLDVSPSLGVLAPALVCSALSWVLAPPPARVAAPPPRDPPPCSSSRAGAVLAVSPLLGPHECVLSGVRVFVSGVGERFCTPASSVFCVLYKCATCFRENGCRVWGRGSGEET